MVRLYPVLFPSGGPESAVLLLFDGSPEESVRSTALFFWYRRSSVNGSALGRSLRAATSDGPLAVVTRSGARSWPAPHVGDDDDFVGPEFQTLDDHIGMGLITAHVVPLELRKCRTEAHFEVLAAELPVNVGGVHTDERFQRGLRHNDVIDPNATI